MAKLISVGTCNAPYELSQKDVKNFIRNLFSSFSGIDSMMKVFDNSEIENRYISVPIEWFSKDHSFSERNRIYRDVSIDLAKKAINSALLDAGAGTHDIDCVIFVSSTGIVTPTLDAVLFNEIGFSRHIKRIPIWGLGCAGGASGVSRALDYVKAYPSHNCLAVALELCSLTFQRDDISKSNIVASSLFSDGCAAVVVSGSESVLANRDGIYLVDSLSTIYDNSLDVMGWDVVDDGFRVLFSRDIPEIVRTLVRPNITELLDCNKIKLSEIEYFVTHPGGVKVISAYEESLGRNHDTFRHSYKILKDHGNMSSPSVLFVLKEFFDNKEFAKGKFGILSSLGPGFSSELVLFRT